MPQWLKKVRPEFLNSVHRGGENGLGCWISKNLYGGKQNQRWGGGKPLNQEIGCKNINHLTTSKITLLQKEKKVFDGGDGGTLAKTLNIDTRDDHQCWYEQKNQYIFFSKYRRFRIKFESPHYLLSNLYFLLSKSYTNFNTLPLLVELMVGFPPSPREVVRWSLRFARSIAAQGQQVSGRVRPFWRAQSSISSWMIRWTAHCSPKGHAGQTKTGSSPKQHHLFSTYYPDWNSNLKLKSMIFLKIYFFQIKQTIWTQKFK